MSPQVPAHPVDLATPSPAAAGFAGGKRFTADDPSLPPATLLFSLAAIALGALVLAALAAGIAFLVLLAHDGREAMAEFAFRAQFDMELQTRLGAGAISLLYAGLAAATLAAARFAGGRDWRRRIALASVRLRWRRVVGICLVTLLYGAALTLALARLQTRGAGADGPTDVLLLATLVGNLTVLAPLAEELLFRGWLYTALRTRFGFGPTFAVTALLFAAMHWYAGHRRILLVMPLALALGLLREACGSIKPTIVLHACYNTLVVALTLALA